MPISDVSALTPVVGFALWTVLLAFLLAFARVSAVQLVQLIFVCLASRH
ncbi:MAG: hypothetical protein ACKVQU_34630 [Burkholderiales bacterium]